MLSVRLPDKLVALLDDWARIRNQSKNSLVARAIEIMLLDHPRAWTPSRGMAVMREKRIYYIEDVFLKDDTIMLEVSFSSGQKHSGEAELYEPIVVLPRK